LRLGPGKLGEDGGIVEAHETYFDRKPNTKKGRRGFRHKNAVLALVERGGKRKSVRVKNFNDIKKVIKDNIDPAAHFMTDKHKKFRKIGKQFASHETVNHFQKEYARGDVTTNTVEGVFSIFKRGIRCVFPQCPHTTG